MYALDKAASHDTSVVVGPLPVTDFVPGITQKMGEFMLFALSGENVMSNLSLRDLDSRDQSEKNYNPILGVQGTIAWALEHFVKCRSIAVRYWVGTGKKNSFLSNQR